MTSKRAWFSATWLSGTYLASVAWSTRTEWRCEKMPRPESWPDNLTGVLSASSVPHAIGFESRGVDFLHRLVARDLLVHQRLGEHRLVRLVVAVPAVAEHVDDDVALEVLAIFGGDARDVDHGLGIVAVHVQDRRLHD